MDGIGYLQAQQSAPGAEGDFIRAFREVFAGAPYFEQHQTAYIRDKVWKRHLAQGLIVLAYSESELAGFGCTLPLCKVKNTPVPDLLRLKGIDSWNHFWHMSELGVREKYRSQGIATALVRNRLLRICERGGTHYSLQTDLKASHSEHLYRKIGATELGEDEETQSKYFLGSCREAILKLSHA